MLRIVNGRVTNRYLEQFQTLSDNPHACDP